MYKTIFFKPLQFFLLFIGLTHNAFASYEPLPGGCEDTARYASTSVAGVTKKGQGLQQKVLSFTTTQIWEPTLKRIRQSPPIYLHSWNQQIQIPAPPVNTSPLTYQELEILEVLQRQRTKQQVALLKSQILLKDFIFGGYKMSELMTANGLPLTRKLFRMVINDLGVVVFSLKHRFDRVRPHFLNNTLNPAIDVPNHPAYPSGHASQAYTLAYLLREIKPEEGKAYLFDACQIAYGREIAGVHYRSDSVAGHQLAKQFIEALTQNQRFMVQLKEVRKEWERQGI